MCYTISNSEGNVMRNSKEVFSLDEFLSPNDKMIWARVLFLELLKQHDLPDIPLNINGKLRSAAGLTKCKYSRITDKCFDFKVSIAKFLFTESKWTLDDIEETIRHETAHYLSLYLHSKAGSGHGSLWANCALRLGATPKHYLRGFPNE